MKLPLTVVACIPLVSACGLYGGSEGAPKEETAVRERLKAAAAGALENLARLRQ